MEQRSLLLVHVQSLSRRAYSLGNAFTLALTNLTKSRILTMGKQGNTKKRVAAGHTPAEAAKELAGVAELVESQKAAGLDHTEVVDTIYNSWLNRLRSMHITTGSDQKLLTNALRGDPWSDEQRKQHDPHEQDLTGTTAGDQQQRRATLPIRRRWAAPFPSDRSGRPGTFAARR